jgi:hypothetical protein
LPSINRLLRGHSPEPRVDHRAKNKRCACLVADGYASRTSACFHIASAAALCGSSRAFAIRKGYIAEDALDGAPFAKCSDIGKQVFYGSAGGLNTCFSSPASICSSLEIEIVPTTVRPSKEQTCAGATLAAILEPHGPDHLTLVLRTIVESVGNERHLKRRSSWLCRTWANRGLCWIEAFDEIDLLALMRRAQPNRKAVQLRPAICTLLFERLSAVFGRPPKGVVAPGAEGHSRLEHFRF